MLTGIVWLKHEVSTYKQNLCRDGAHKLRIIWIDMFWGKVAKGRDHAGEVAASVNTTNAVNNAQAPEQGTTAQEDVNMDVDFEGTK